MAACRKLLLPSVFSVLFCFNLLSTNLGKRNAQDPLGERYVNDNGQNGEGRQMLEFDGLLSTVAIDSSIKAKVHPSTILPRHQALIFDPPSLDFREHGVGMPKLHTVRITNPSSTQPLHLNSISGDSPVFHASFFRSKVVKAGESTTFDVVFLARVVGTVRNILYIQSSQGTFEYEVQGVGTSNPFRLRSLLGARIPLNATYSPLITMYNPYNRPLQITEMYSSSGELHIELLSGQAEGAKSLWELRPYETKPIARANFFGLAVTNHTSFVRVKTDHTSSPSVVLPVEVEVSDDSGLFLSRELLDFGVVKGGETKILPLYILNSGHQQVHIKSVSVTPENHAVEVEYMTTLLRPGSKYTKIALIKLHSDRVSSPQQTTGHIVIQAEDKIVHQLEVPFEASVLSGSLSYEKSSTLFTPGKPPFTPIAKKISLSNQFDSPVVVYDAKLPSKAQDYFVVSTFTDPFILPPSSEWHHPFSILFLPSSSDCLFNTTLRLSTNATYFNIPLHCYDGRVKYSLEDPDEDSLEFGVLSETDVVSKTFNIHNVNPVKIFITAFSVSPELPCTTVRLFSIFPSNSSPPSAKQKKKILPYALEPGYSAQFNATVTHPNTIGKYSGEITVHTSFDKTVRVPVYFRIAESRLKVIPEVIKFEPSFPYTVSKVPLYVKNLYHQPLRVTSVTSDLNDPRFYVEEVDGRDGDIRLKPAEKAEIGTVVFDPLLGEKENIYLGKLSGEGEVGDSLWSTGTLDSASKPKDPSKEVRQYSNLWSSWNSMVNDGMDFFNFTFVVSSDLGGEVRVPSTASLVWPDLVPNDEKIVTLTPTNVGNTSIHHLHITNPTDWPLLIQPVFLTQYLHPQIIVDSLSDRISPKLRNLNFSLSSSSFAFIDPVETSVSSDTALPTSILPPLRKQFEITVAFSPKVNQELNTLLLLRNNLTVYDYIILQGAGIQGAFAIDGIQPETDPLTFEFASTVIENCQAGMMVDPLKLTKTFRMHNSGPTPIVLRILGLESGACDGRGFVVSNCDKDITIQPNRTKKFDITFTPDYSLTQVSNTLKIQTSSGNELLYPLLAILPHQLLAACFALQPRPEWEKNLAWLSVPFWLFVLLSIMATVFVQTKFGMRKGLIPYKNDSKVPILQPSEGQVFNLKDVQSALSKKIIEVQKKSFNTPENAPMEGQGKERLTEPSKETEPDRSHVATKKITPAPLSTTTSQVPIQKAFVPPLQPHVRYRTNVASSKPDKTTAVQDTPSPSSVTHSKSPPNTVPASMLKGKLSKSPVSDSDTSIGCSSKVSTDNHTGAREQVQPSENVNNVTQQVLALTQTLNKPKASEKVLPEKPSPKSLPETAPNAPPADTATASGTMSQAASSPNGKKLKSTRKLIAKVQKPPLEVSPLPSSALKELERKASESSIISTNSDSTTSSVDKSEDADTPSQVQNLVTEVKFEKPRSFTKEPNTGQTIHPTESSDVVEAEKSEQRTDPPKKDKDTGTPPPIRIKGKKKLRQQQKKEEKARRREKEREKERDKERELEREKAESEKFSKRSSGSFEDSSSSNSIEQLEEDLSPQDDYLGEAVSLSDEKSVPDETYDKLVQRSSPTVNSGVSPAIDKSVETPELESERVNVTKYPLRESVTGENSKGSMSPPPPSLQISPANAVPSTAIKTSRGKSTKHQVKDVVTDPFSRMPDRSTYNSKKVSGKKAAEKTTTVKTPSLASEKSAPSQEELAEVQVEAEQSSPKQRPHTLPVILTEPDAEYDEGDVFIDPGSAETDGVSHTLLKVDSKSNCQSLPTSPHELAASLLSNNSAIMRRKQRSDRDKSDDGLEDDEEIAISESEVKEISATSARGRQSAKPDYTTSPQKDLSPHPHPNQIKPLSTPLSLDAEPFYPSPHFQPKPPPNPRMADSRKNSRTNPPGFSPTSPDDAYMGPYPEQHYLKREHLPPRHHISKSMTPSPPPSFPSFPDGHHMLADYPGLDPHDPLGPVNNDEQYAAPDEVPFMHGSMGGGRYSDRYRGRGVAEPHIVAKGGRSRPLGPSSSAFADSYMANLHQQQLAQYHRGAAVRERSHGVYPSGHGALWEQPKPHRPPPPSVEEPAAQQYLRKRQYLLNLVKKERATLAAAVAREQARRSAEAISSMGQPQKRGHSSVFGPDMSHSHQFNSRMWDDIEPFSDPHMDELSLSDSILAHQIRQRQQLLHNQALMRPSRSRTYSNESDLGGEFVSDLQSQLPSPSTVGAPGQPFSSRGDRSAKNLAPGRARSSGWPGETQVSSPNWDSNSLWPLDSPFFDGSPSIQDTVPDDNSPASGSLAGQRSLSDTSGQPFASTAYDLFENQSIWSLNNSDSSDLLSWAQLKPDQSEGKHNE